MSETATIGQQLEDAIVSRIVGEADLPDVEVNRRWDVEPDKIGERGVILVATRTEEPAKEQRKDQPVDVREVTLTFVVWALTRARADEILARIQQVVCFAAPALSASPFFQLAYRIRGGFAGVTTAETGHATGQLSLIADTQQAILDPTRWH